MALPSRAARLAPVVEMAEEAERKAAQRLGHFQQQLAQAQAKLAELERFREDYQLQWINRGGQGSTATGWSTTNAFSVSWKRR